MLGMPSLPIVVVDHPISGQRPEVPQAMADATFEEAVHVLTSQAHELTEEYAARQFPDPKRAVVSDMESPPPEGDDRLPFEGTFEEFNEMCLRRGLGDGLPLVPPTELAVAHMLAGTDMSPHTEVATVPPANGVATVQKIAINALMAGCKPEHMPVLIAAVEAMADPAFHLTAVQTTTNPAAPLAIVHGPAVDELRFNAGYNLFGQGWRSNATVGRAIRLILLNLGGGRPGDVDRSTLGQPGKYSFCIAENSKESPWEPLHVERGFPVDASAVTVVGTAGPHNMLDSASQSAEELLTMFAKAVTVIHNNVFFPGQPTFVIGPEHAQLIAQDGYGKEEVKAFLFEHARVPIEGFSPAIISELRKRRPGWFERQKGVVTIPIADTPEDIVLVVAGGPGRHSAFLPTFGYQTKAVTYPIRSPENATKRSP